MSITEYESIYQKIFYLFFNVVIVLVVLGFIYIGFKNIRDTLRSRGIFGLILSFLKTAIMIALAIIAFGYFKSTGLMDRIIALLP